MSVKITKEDFEDYESIRQSGLTNMFDINKVVALSKGLIAEKCFKIMENYFELKEKFTEKEK